MANNVNSIYNLLQTTLAVLTSAESCITYFRDPQSRASAEPRTSNKHLHKHTARRDGPRKSLQSQFNIILTGFRARLVIADVMLNQLEMNTYATTNHNTLFAVPDNKGGDDRNEVDNSSTNKTDQYIRTLVAEMRQLRDYVASVAEVASIKNDDCFSDDGYSDDYYSDGDVPDSGGGDVSNEPLINPGLD